MTTTTAPALPISTAVQWACTIDNGRAARTVTMTRHLIDETITLFRVDGWDYRLHAIETSDQGDVYVDLIRQTRKGHDYKNGLGVSTTLVDFAASPTSSPLHLAGLVARIEATVAALTAPADVDDEEPDREPSAEQERAWDAREDDARGHALTHDADALAGTPLAADAPLGTIRFHEGSEDAPQCPCGNDVNGDGFRSVIVAESTDGKVGVFIDADGAWHALGRHVACLADYCLRVWSDRDIVTDATGTWAPVTMRLHHVAESTVEAFSTTPAIEAGMDRNAASWPADALRTAAQDLYDQLVGGGPWPTFDEIARRLGRALSTAAPTVAELADRIRAAYPVTEGRAGFLSDPGGWIAYLGLTGDDATAAAAIELIRAETA